MGISCFLTFLEDDFRGHLSLGLLITLAVAPAGSVMVVAVQGCLPGGEAVSCGGGVAGEISSDLYCVSGCDIEK